MMTVVPTSEGMLGVLNALGIETVEIEGKGTYGVFGPFAISTSSPLSVSYFTDNGHTAIQIGLIGGISSPTSISAYRCYKASADLIIIQASYSTASLGSIVLAKTKGGNYIAMGSVGNSRTVYIAGFNNTGASWSSTVSNSASADTFRAPPASNIDKGAVLAFPFVVTQTLSSAVLGDMVCNTNGECLLYFINEICAVPYDEVFTINGASFIRATSFMLLRLT